ncbi:Fe-S cluster assembly protein SufD [Halobacteriovorax marinus]|uniref:Fe-S cluster assembly protein SufD n=1 Tax=Halobacteriovorax marinus TaxID=97084 RepID=A0A1Y5F7X2_9BACT|nr:Fe-S cluster assembly protein SufD [Halobacteriovorax marinus]
MKIEQLSENYINDLEKFATTKAKRMSLAHFKKVGLPHTKMEDWLYTKLTDVLPSNFAKVESSATLTNVKVPGKFQIVLLNGQYSKVDSFIPDEISVEIVNSDLLDETDFREDQKDIFAHVNAITCHEVIKIHVPKNLKLEDSISIVHVSDFKDSFSSPRVIIEAEMFSEIDFVEIFTGVENSSYNTNAVTSFLVKENAKVSHTKVQIEGMESFHVASVYADVEKNATFSSFSFSTGAKKSRNNIEVALKGVGSKGNVHGLYALTDVQHCDNFSIINHLVEHTESDQLFKGVLDGESRAVFTGKIKIFQDAQKVYSEQLNKNLLLSKKAHIDTRPQLEVNADDVKCSHGATIGQMSEEEEFYLRSRGLSVIRAQKLLIHAFCSDAIYKVENESIQKYLSEVLFESFEKKTFQQLEQGK